MLVWCAGLAKFRMMLFFCVHYAETASPARSEIHTDWHGKTTEQLNNVEAYTLNSDQH